MALRLFQNISSRIRGHSHEDNFNASFGSHRSKAVSLDRRAHHPSVTLAEKSLTVRHTRTVEQPEHRKAPKKYSKRTDDTSEQADVTNSSSTFVKRGSTVDSLSRTRRKNIPATLYSGDHSGSSPDTTVKLNHTQRVSNHSRSLTESTLTTTSLSSSQRANSTLQFLGQTCPICKRVYGSASIHIHIRGCQAAKDIQREQLAAKLTWENKLIRRPTHPPGTICFVCGRRYTHASWRIHVPRCKKQWALWNYLLPKGRRHRKLPKTPEPSEQELINRIERAHAKGLAYYRRDDALDEVMLEESERNRLPLEMLWMK